MILLSTLFSFSRGVSACAVRQCSSRSDSPKSLYKFLIRQCEKLPEAPRKYYKFMVKQSFKQHVNETDPGRIKQIIKRSYEDADWVLKKYLSK